MSSPLTTAPNQNINHFENNTWNVTKGIGIFSAREKIIIDNQNGDIIIQKVSQTGFQHFKSVIENLFTKNKDFYKDVTVIYTFEPNFELKQHFNQEVEKLKTAENAIISVVFNKFNKPEELISNIETELKKIVPLSSQEAPPLAKIVYDTLQQPEKHTQHSPLKTLEKSAEKVDNINVQSLSTISSQTVAPPKESESDRLRAEALNKRQEDQLAQLTKISERISAFVIPPESKESGEKQLETPPISSEERAEKLKQQQELSLHVLAQLEKQIQALEEKTIGPLEEERGRSQERVNERSREGTVETRSSIKEEIHEDLPKELQDQIHTYVEAKEKFQEAKNAQKDLHNKMKEEFLIHFAANEKLKEIKVEPKTMPFEMQKEIRTQFEVKEKLKEIKNGQNQALKDYVQNFSQSIENLSWQAETAPKYSQLATHLLEQRKNELQALLIAFESTPNPMDPEEFSSLIQISKFVDAGLLSAINRNQSGGVQSLLVDSFSTLQKLFNDIPLPQGEKRFNLKNLPLGDFKQTIQRYIELDTANWSEKEAQALAKFLILADITSRVTSEVELQKQTQKLELLKDLQANLNKIIKQSERISNLLAPMPLEKTPPPLNSLVQEMIKAHPKITDGLTTLINEYDIRNTSVLQMASQQELQETFDKIPQTVSSKALKSSLLILPESSEPVDVSLLTTADLNKIVAQFHQFDLTGWEAKDVENLQQFFIQAEIAIAVQDATTDTIPPNTTLNKLVLPLIKSYPHLEDELLTLLEQSRRDSVENLLNDSMHHLQMYFNQIPWPEGTVLQDLASLTPIGLNSIVNQLQTLDRKGWDSADIKNLQQFFTQAEITLALLDSAIISFETKKDIFEALLQDFTNTQHPEVVNLINTDLEIPSISERTPIHELIPTIDSWIEEERKLEISMSNLGYIAPVIDSYDITFKQAMPKRRNDSPYLSTKIMETFQVELPPYEDTLNENILPWAESVTDLKNELEFRIDMSNKAQVLQKEIITIVDPLIDKTKREENQKKQALETAFNALFPKDEPITFKGVETAIVETNKNLEKIRDQRVTKGFLKTVTQPISSLTVEELLAHREATAKEIANQEKRLAQDPLGMQKALKYTNDFKQVCQDVDKTIDQYLKQPETIPLAYALRIAQEREKANLYALAKQKSNDKTLNRFSAGADKATQALTQRLKEVATMKRETDFLKQLNQVSPDSTEATDIKNFFIAKVQTQLNDFQMKEMGEAADAFVSKVGLPVDPSGIQELTNQITNDILGPSLQIRRTVTEGMIPGMRSSIEKRLDQLTGPQLIAFEQEALQAMQKGRDALQVMNKALQKAETAQQEYAKTIDQASQQIKKYISSEPPQYVHAALLQQTIDEAKAAHQTFMEGKKNQLKSSEDFEQYASLAGHLSEELIARTESLTEVQHLTFIEQLKEVEKHNLKFTLTIDGKPLSLNEHLKQQYIDTIRQPILTTIQSNNNALIDLLNTSELKQLPQEATDHFRGTVHEANTKLNDLGLTFNGKSIKTLSAIELEQWGDITLNEIEKGITILKELHLEDAAKTIKAYNTRLNQLSNIAENILSKNMQILGAQFVEGAINRIETQRQSAFENIKTAKDLQNYEALLKTSIEELNLAEKKIPVLGLEEQLSQLEQGSKDYNIVLSELIKTQREDIIAFRQNYNAIYQQVNKKPAETDWKKIILQLISAKAGLTEEASIDTMRKSQEKLESAYRQINREFSFSPKWKEALNQEIINQMNLPFQEYTPELNTLNVSPKEFRAFRENVESLMYQGEMKIREIIPLDKVDSAIAILERSEGVAANKVRLLRAQQKNDLAAELEAVLYEQRAICGKGVKQIFSNTQEMLDFSSKALDSAGKLDAALDDIKKRESKLKSLPSKLEQMQNIEKKFPETYGQQTEYQILHKEEFEPAAKALKEVTAELYNHLPGYKQYLSSYNEDASSSVSEWMKKAAPLYEEIQRLQNEPPPIKASQLIKYEKNVKGLVDRAKKLLETLPEF